MTMFKKKNNIPAIYVLLDSSLQQAKDMNKKNFYYALFDNEIDLARKWCLSRGVRLELDHINDKNKVYKFNI